MNFVDPLSERAREKVKAEVEEWVSAVKVSSLFKVPCYGQCVEMSLESDHFSGLNFFVKFLIFWQFYSSILFNR